MFHNPPKIITFDLQDGYLVKFELISSEWEFRNLLKKN